LEPHSDTDARPLFHAALPYFNSIPPLVQEQTPEAEVNEEVSLSEASPAPSWWRESGLEIARATRSWIQYGTLAFAVICIVVGAVEALFGR
jgi:hypothetical protein